jgi:hypothetical protein
MSTKNNMVRSHVVVVESESTKAEVLEDLLESEEDKEQQKQAFAKNLKPVKKEGEHETT